MKIILATFDQRSRKRPAAFRPSLVGGINEELTTALSDGTRLVPCISDVAEWTQQGLAGACELVLRDPSRAERSTKL
jgi:hypothetical protein